MKKTLIYAGKALQAMALLVLPASIWAGQIGHDERGAIAILVGTVGCFLLGVGLIQLASRF